MHFSVTLHKLSNTDDKTLSTVIVFEQIFLSFMFLAKLISVIMGYFLIYNFYYKYLIFIVFQRAFFKSAKFKSFTKAYTDPSVNLENQKLSIVYVSVHN